MILFPPPSIPCLAPVEHDCRTQSGLLGLCLFVAFGVAMISPVSAEQWTYVSGEKTIEAKFVGVIGEKAILELPNGKRGAVALRDLQYESRQRALDMEQARQEHMATLTNELQRAAEKEQEKDPERISPPESAAPEYEPLPENASLEETIQHVNRQLEAAHLRAFWDALPPSYQTDVEEIVGAFATQMDPALWQDILGLVNRVTELLASRQRWVFSYPAIAEAGVEEPLREGYRSVLGALQTIFDPQVMTLERLREGNLGELIAERDALLANHLYPLAQLAPADSGFDAAQIEVKMIDDNRGTVTFKPPGTESPGSETPSSGSPPPGMSSPPPGMSSPPPGMSSPPPGYSTQGSSMPGYPSAGSSAMGAAQPQTWVLVEGRWVPEAMAKEWEQQIEDLKGKIKDELPKRLAEMRSDLTAFKSAVDTIIAPLEEAESEAEFHAGIDRLAMQVAGFAMQAFGGMNQGNRPGGSPYGSGMGMPGYSQEMEMQGYGQEMEAQGYGQEMESYGEEGDGGSTQPNGSRIQIPR